MYYEVYLDFYFLENFFTDLILLTLLRILLRENWKKKRMLVCAAAESLLSSVGLLLSFHFSGSWIWSQTVGVWILAGCGWQKKTAKHRIYAIGLLGIVSFSLAGGVLAVENFWNIPVFAAKMLIFLILSIGLGCYSREDREKQRIFEVTIFLHGKSKKIQALYDTGNRLREPYQGRPVNVIEYEAVKELLLGKERIFLIPYRTIGSDGKMLTGLTFDRMLLKKGEKIESYLHPVMALTKENVSSDQSYQMILHPDNRKEEEKEYDKNSRTAEISVQNGKRMAEYMVSKDK